MTVACDFVGHHLGDIFLWSNIVVSCDYNTLFTPSPRCGVFEESCTRVCARATNAISSHCAVAAGLLCGTLLYSHKDLNAM